MPGGEIALNPVAKAGHAHHRITGAAGRPIVGWNGLIVLVCRSSWVGRFRKPDVEIDLKIQPDS
jgi:hypothetical protein